MQVWKWIVGTAVGLALIGTGIAYGISSWQFSLLWMTLTAVGLYSAMKHSSSQQVEQAPAVSRVKQEAGKPPRSGCCH